MTENEQDPNEPTSEIAEYQKYFKEANSQRNEQQETTTNTVSFYEIDRDLDCKEGRDSNWNACRSTCKGWFCRNNPVQYVLTFLHSIPENAFDYSPIRALFKSIGNKFNSQKEELNNIQSLIVEILQRYGDLTEGKIWNKLDSEYLGKGIIDQMDRSKKSLEWRDGKGNSKEMKWGNFEKTVSRVKKIYFKS
jgi:hypothetical protein